MRIRRFILAFAAFTMFAASSLFAQSDATSGASYASGTKKKVLVAFFSATGTTKKVAEYIAAVTGGDLHEIFPATLYDPKDLDFNNRASRIIREQNDDKARPIVAYFNAIENMDEYDIVFIGFPIWWGKAPKLIYTFLEKYNFAGKRIIPFCTSASSPIGPIQKDLAKLLPRATWDNKGKRFDAKTDRADIEKWVRDLKQ